MPLVSFFLRNETFDDTFLKKINTLISANPDFWNGHLYAFPLKTSSLSTYRFSYMDSGLSLRCIINKFL